MLRDITLGQYIPGDTVIHRLDPRCKIILTILYIAIIFCVTSPVWYVIPLAYLLVASRLSGLSAKRLLKSVKPLRFLLILTFLLNLFFSTGTTVWVQWGFLRITQEGFLTAVHFSMGFSTCAKPAGAWPNTNMISVTRSLAARPRAAGEAASV